MHTSLKRSFAWPEADELDNRRPTESLCPECLAVISAQLVVEQGKVWMHKTCPHHGAFSDLISSDADFFVRLERLAGCSPGPGTAADDPSAVEDEVSLNIAGYPTCCGLCENHLSRTMMLNIDLTNRCNLHCPICFANADARGYVYEISREEVRQMLRDVLARSPARPSCLQFSGGEPTLHPEFLAILRDASQFKLAQIQAASNGLRFGQEPDFAAACAEAGLNNVYLQFDGLSDDIYKKSRGRCLVDLKRQAVENLYQAGIRVTLVPTIVNGVNDHQVGPILRYAIENIDKIAAISWQPVAFTGRIDRQQRLRQRFTLADLARCIEEQTGWVDMHRDWYPYSFVEPFCRLVEAISGEAVAHTNCHGHCGMATYLIVNPGTGEVVPMPRMVDVEPLMEQIDILAERLRNASWLGTRWHTARTTRRLARYFHPDLAPAGWDFSLLLDFLQSFVEFNERYPDNIARTREREQQESRSLLLAAMHFQDAYNFEIDRVRRCVVHYATPDGRMYPFCTYNCGPCFRDRVERQFARPRA